MGKVHSMNKYKPFQNNKISQKFSSYPEDVRSKLLDLRNLILEVAAKTKGVGTLDECLKWNEPSFVTLESKSGSTIRIDWKKSDPERYHMYFNCNTKLVSIFKELFPDDFEYGGNRSLSFALKEKTPVKKLAKCIEIALTYNLNDYKNFFEFEGNG